MRRVWGHPIDQICAIVTSRDLLDKIVHALSENGFKPDAIDLLQGKRDAQKLDEATGKQGLLARVAKMWPEFGDRDSTYLVQYREALLQDEAVDGIAVRDEKPPRFTRSSKAAERVSWFTLGSSSKSLSRKVRKRLSYAKTLSMVAVRIEMSEGLVK